ncbi:MAG: sulfite exporter TauE/SafE family protein [Planctomycetota bacterium]|nr:sulfite exporter TauE/SafE family protein [Planctomycetota bacterium]
MALLEMASFAGIGLIAGLIGGLLGIGGSTVFIPAASLIIAPDQQIYQAAAMILNVFVSGTATLAHHRAGAIDFRLVRRVVPAAVLFVLLGVGASNQLDATILERLFGGLLLLLAATETFRIWRNGKLRREATKRNSTSAEGDAGEPRTSLPILAGIGGVMGFLGGLLGIGGGTIAVPGLRFAARLPLRNSIAIAATVTIPMAMIGAIYKNLTLSELSGPDGASLSATQSIGIALVIVPTAILGSWIGARLVHRLPLMTIRICFIALLLVAGFRMLNPLGS